MPRIDTIIMARRAIPMIAFHEVASLYNIIISLCHHHTCIVYAVKELCHSRGISQAMAILHNRMCARALQTSTKKAACSLRRN